MNTTTGAQRTNKRQDAIWENAKKLKAAQPEHSPLPWNIRSEDEITADDKTQVCTFFACPQSEANAAYIVKSCNQYPKLVEALKCIHSTLGTFEGKSDANPSGLIIKAFYLAQEAVELTDA